MSPADGNADGSTPRRSRGKAPGREGHCGGTGPQARKKPPQPQERAPRGREWALALARGREQWAVQGGFPPGKPSGWRDGPPPLSASSPPSPGWTPGKALPPVCRPSRTRCRPGAGQGGGGQDSQWGRRESFPSSTLRRRGISSPRAGRGRLWRGPVLRHSGIAWRTRSSWRPPNGDFGNPQKASSKNKVPRCLRARSGVPPQASSPGGNGPCKRGAGENEPHSGREGIRPGGRQFHPPGAPRRQKAWGAPPGVPQGARSCGCASAAPQCRPAHWPSPSWPPRPCSPPGVPVGRIG